MILKYFRLCKIIMPLLCTYLVYILLRVGLSSYVLCVAACTAAKPSVVLYRILLLQRAIQTAYNRIFSIRQVIDGIYVHACDGILVGRGFTIFHSC
jgi:hypothetical protein